MFFSKRSVLYEVQSVGVPAKEGVCQHQTDKQGKGNPSKIVKTENPEFLGVRRHLYF